MIRIQLAALVAAAGLSISCGGAVGGGSVSGSASVSVEAEIKVPIAKMPPKYAAWVVEAEGYLYAVDRAYERYSQAKTELAAALGVEADANVIAQFIRDAIQVETQLVCQPPSFNAGLVGQCTADANARASGRAGSGGASGQAAAGIEANCRARASLSLKPGSCTLQTTVTEHPILSDPDRWARIEANMQVMLQMAAVNDHLNGRGSSINSRGLELHVESVTDLAEDPTLALQLNKIQAELKKGADAASAANETQSAMNDELGTIGGAIDDQFPQMRASVNAG